jgi:hypothetical protein
MLCKPEKHEEKIEKIEKHDAFIGPSCAAEFPLLVLLSLSEVLICLNHILLTLLQIEIDSVNDATLVKDHGVHLAQ